MNIYARQLRKPVITRFNEVHLVDCIIIEGSTCQSPV